MNNVIPTPTEYVVIISADAEWKALRRWMPHVTTHKSPFGEWFATKLMHPEHSRPGEKLYTQVLFFQGGWGKVDAAASAQYVIDHCSPSLLINLGTCGGFKGLIERGTIILVEKTVIYDIIEQMGDFEEHIRHYATQLDLSWLNEPYPQVVTRTLMVSGDRDLRAEDVPILYKKYGAVAGDWESGAIAHVAKRNERKLLILRGVTDLVDPEGGEAYGNLGFFENAAYEIMEKLVTALPQWIACIRKETTG